MQEVIQQLPAPHYRSENCCPECGELSPAAFQRAMMRWQALSHAHNMMPVCVEVVAGSFMFDGSTASSAGGEEFIHTVRIWLISCVSLWKPRAECLTSLDACRAILSLS